MQNNTTNISTKEPVRKTFSSLVEWRDFLFMNCDDTLKEETIKILTERELLKPDGKSGADPKPNNPKIEENASFFGTSLAERLNTSRTVKIIGLSKIKTMLLEYSTAKDYKGMYFFVVYLYGITRWRTPFNLQRMPVSTSALKSYMTYFCEAFSKRVDELIAEKTYETAIAEESQNETDTEESDEESL